MMHRLAALVAMVILAATLVPAAQSRETTVGCTLVELFHRQGCPHCEQARRFLDQLGRELPALEIRSYDVILDPLARQRFVDLNTRFGIQRPGVPAMLLCEHYLVGFSDVTTPRRVRDILAGGDVLPAPLPEEGATVDLPLVGRVALADVGLPLFTIAIGLLDGFNPCAMWVLLFLLSLLVNLRSRRRMLIISGTFVAVSGVVYFAFMAAWLNLFLVLGMSSVLQALIGALALAVGVIHIKDFFASGHGPSLSIPGSARPGIYARARAIVQAENLPGALLLVALMAIMVNLVELLCTAGLPALYTRILTLQQMSAASYYAYLVLYNLAYVFDDAMMVGVVVYSLSRAKLRPDQGRWLKLVSGVTVLALGLALLAAPELLI